MPTIYDLPPLILHPFTEAGAPERLVEDSKAGLILAGMLPGDGSPDQYAEQVARARYVEIRMLFFIGKDVRRWIEQCLECVERTEDLKERGFREQSFALLLTRDTPPGVRDKLRNWGVTDYAAIFTRALGLYAAFAAPPEPGQLGREFVLNYHRYADFLFACWQQPGNFTELAPEEFHFDLYASGEYSRLLESQWGGV